MTIKYLQIAEVQGRKIDELENWQRYANVTGYGNKIPTQYMLRIDNRWHRVYCICYSNSGSLYVLRNKESFFLSIDVQLELR